MRWWARSWRSVRPSSLKPVCPFPSATRSESLGFGTPAGCAGIACAETRTSARSRATQAGTPTADTPNSLLCQRHSLTGCRQATPTPSWRHCCARASSATGRCCAPPGGRLGLYGFGGSAHITAQVALAQGIEVHVMTRDPAAQELARSLGAASVQGAADTPPVALDSALVFAPFCALVLPALEALDPFGTLAIAGIHLSDIPPYNYQRHLFYERQLRSVTSNTRADAREVLAFAEQHRIEVSH